jgi:lysozyme family protein
MMTSKYYSPKFYYDLATAQLQMAYRQLFTLKILIFALSVVSVTTGYARPTAVLQQAMNNASQVVNNVAHNTVENAVEEVSAFLQAQERTAEFEGGYQRDSRDNGNWTGGRRGRGRLVGTNHGISAPLLASYLGRTPSIADMKNLTAETANEIYRKQYWAQIKGDEIKDKETAAQIYDSAVNMGIGTAIMLTQRSLGLPETKVMDQATLDALNAGV